MSTDYTTAPTGVAETAHTTVIANPDIHILEEREQAVFRESSSRLPSGRKLAFITDEQIKARIFKYGTQNARVLPGEPQGVWPHWVYAQLIPDSPHFHAHWPEQPLINTTFRKWCGLGFPGFDTMAIVDSHGLMTPATDQWSLDVWLALDHKLVSAQALDSVKQIRHAHTGAVTTEFHIRGISTRTTHTFIPDSVHDGYVMTRVTIENTLATAAQCSAYLALLPVNPEGISPIESLAWLSSDAMMVNHQIGLVVDQKPDNIVCLNRKDGALVQNLGYYDMSLKTECREGLAVGWIEYRLSLKPGETRTLTAWVPASRETVLFKPGADGLSADSALQLSHLVTYFKSRSVTTDQRLVETSWQSITDRLPLVRVPEPAIQAMLAQSVSHMLLSLETNSVLSGPMACRGVRWLDSAIVFHCLNRLGLTSVTRDLLPGYLAAARSPFHPSVAGYSAALWMLADTLMQSGTATLMPRELAFVKKAVRYLESQRVLKTPNPELSGLVRPTRGLYDRYPDDHYFLDLAWLSQGIKCALVLIRMTPHTDLEKAWADLYDQVTKTLDQNLAYRFERLRQPAFLPLSHTRLLDPGMVYSLLGVYPLAVIPADAEIVTQSRRYIYQFFSKQGRFFNPLGAPGYDVLANLILAHTELLAQDARVCDRLRWLTRAGGETGALPGAVHPKTGSGSSGDGTMAINSALYTQLIYQMLCQESEYGIALCPALPKDWIVPGQEISLTRMPTRFGIVNFTLHIISPDQAILELDNQFTNPPEYLTLGFPYRIRSWRTQEKEFAVNLNHISLPARATRIMIRFSPERSEQEG